MTLTLSGLWVHPLKGARGVRVAAAQVGDRGLVDDRRWMLVDDAGVFVTQREHPALALVAAEATPEGLVVRIPGGGAHGASRGGGAPGCAELWGASVEVEETRGDAAAALSEHLGRAVRVVYQPDGAGRRVGEAYGDDRVSFADGFPFLLAGEASLRDLSARVGAELPMERFRPNLAFTGGAPWCEDELDAFRIGPVRFRAVKPCGRCVVVTVDPETAATGPEPLRALASFRRRGNDVIFGQNLIHEGAGWLRVGDALEPA